ncbi:MAG TPA: HTH domain-containing protein [Candidatus Baltobacteraceae bacterium]|jgi:hypothetical protein|nr:HTH domain-containing protein [Candidatus Baltobacteraceae bacterium]
MTETEKIARVRAHISWIGEEIAQLDKQRAAIDAEVQALQRMRESDVNWLDLRSLKSDEVSVPLVDHPRSYSYIEAAKRILSPPLAQHAEPVQLVANRAGTNTSQILFEILREAKRPMHVSEIWKEAERRGAHSYAQNPEHNADSMIRQAMTRIPQLRSHGSREYYWEEE